MHKGQRLWAPSPHPSPTLTRSPGHVAVTPLDPPVSPALALDAGRLEAARQGSDPAPLPTPLLLGAPRLSPKLVPRPCHSGHLGRPCCAS